MPGNPAINIVHEGRRCPRCSCTGKQFALRGPAQRFIRRGLRNCHRQCAFAAALYLLGQSVVGKLLRAASSAALCV